MKKRLIDKIDFFSIGMRLVPILIFNFSLYGFFLLYEESIYSKQKFFIFLIYASGNVFLFYLSHRMDKKHEKERQERIERIEREKSKKMESSLTKDGFIKKYLSNEKYKEFQEMLNSLQENEKDDFRDLMFSELLKKQVEKYIKGGNDN